MKQPNNAFETPPSRSANNSSVVQPRPPPPGLSPESAKMTDGPFPAIAARARSSACGIDVSFFTKRCRSAQARAANSFAVASACASLSREVATSAIPFLGVSPNTNPPTTDRFMMRGSAAMRSSAAFIRSA